MPTLSIPKDSANWLLNLRRSQPRRSNLDFTNLLASHAELPVVAFAPGEELVPKIHAPIQEKSCTIVDETTVQPSIGEKNYMSVFASIEHFFARVAHEVHTISTFTAQHQGEINAAVTAGAAIATSIAPKDADAIATVANGTQNAFGKIAAALSTGDSAVQGGMLSVPADLAFIQSIKDAIAAAKTIVPTTANASTSGLPTFTGQPASAAAPAK